MNLDEKTLVLLKKAAREAALASYSPYSNFPVGSAVLGDNGVIYKGTNVEVVSFTGSTCAERSATVSAISSGVKSLVAIAVYSPSEKLISPCGTCRQIISEFTNASSLVLCFNEKEQRNYTIGDLLPDVFDLIDK